MKHARQDYNTVQDSSEKIPENEPVFLLRGQDPLSPKMLKTYAKRLKKLGGDPEMVQIVKDWAKTIKNYQKTIDTHIPDLPQDENRSTESL